MKTEYSYTRSAFDPILQRNDDLYPHILHLIPSPIAYIDRDLRFRFVNQACAHILGTSSDAVSGKMITEFVGYQSFEELKPYLDKALSGRQQQFESTLSIGMHLLDLDFCLVPDLDHNRVVKGILMQIKTKAKHPELESEAYKELEKINKELSTFAYVSSHDLQEPLRKIQTFTSRILDTEDKNLSEKGLDYFHRIEATAVRMKTMIDDLLTYSRTNTADRKFVLTDLNVLWEDVVSELSELIEAKGAVVESGKLPQLPVIPFQITQLFTNLLANALKFSKVDTVPRITVKADTVKGSEITGAEAGESDLYHHISFSDNGIGFQPEFSTRIFEVFQRLHNRSEYEGTGIGLSICKKIAENHGGIITAEGEVSKGATFHIYLPCLITAALPSAHGD